MELTDIIKKIQGQKTRHCLFFPIYLPYPLTVKYVFLSGIKCG